MKTGTVRWFNLKKGCGFVHPDDGGHNILVHRSSVESAGMSDPKGGQRQGVHKPAKGEQRPVLTQDEPLGRLVGSSPPAAE